MKSIALIAAVLICPMYIFAASSSPTPGLDKTAMSKQIKTVKMSITVDMKTVNSAAGSRQTAVEPLLAAAQSCTPNNLNRYTSVNSVNYSFDFDRNLNI